MTLTIIFPPSAKPIVQLEPSIYCPNDRYYIAPYPRTADPMLTHVKSLYQAEKERSEWIRRYDRVLAGLNYWRTKAMESK